MKKGKGVHLKSTLDFLRLFIKPILKLNYKGDLSKLSLSETVANFLGENEKDIFTAKITRSFKFSAHKYIAGNRVHTNVIKHVKSGDMVLISIDKVLKSVNIEFEDYEVYRLSLNRFNSIRSNFDELSGGRFRDTLSSELSEQK